MMASDYSGEAMVVILVYKNPLIFSTEKKKIWV